MVLVAKTGLKVTRLDLAGDEVFLHTIEHVEIGPARHFLLVDLVVGLLEADRKLLEALLVVSNGAFNLGFLDVEAGDLLTDAVILLLFDGDLLLGLIVLFLDLSKLHAHFIDLLLLVLGGRSIISWVKQ